MAAFNPTDPVREQKLVRAWDFLEHWQKRLSQSDGEKRLEEFYVAIVKLLRRENIKPEDIL